MAPDEPFDWRPVHSINLPLWPWRSVLTSDRLEIRRPFQRTVVVPLHAIASVVLSVGGGYEMLTVRDGNGELLGQAGQWKFVPRFLTTLTRLTGCEVVYRDGGHRPYGGGGPE